MQKKLKVQYSNRRTASFACKTLPKIQMEGKWLAALGFEVGEEIDVSYEKGSILIRLAESDKDKLETSRNIPSHQAVS